MTELEWIRMARSDQFWMGFLPALLTAGLSFHRLFRDLLRLRLVADTPVSLIRSAPQGYIELQGIARLMAGEPIVAPLSGQPCVWYRYTVEERGGPKDEWRTVEQGQSTAIFHLDDGTGRCIVDPEGAEVTPSLTRHWSGGSRRPGGPPRRESGWERFARRDRYRYQESLIREHEPLYVIGAFRALASGDPGTTQDAVGQVLRRWKQDPAALRQRFDTDRDGQISPLEWESALQLAEREALLHWDCSAEAEINLIRRPADGRPFLLSTLPERELRNRYRRQAWLAAILFLLFGSAAAWALVLRYGAAP